MISNSFPIQRNTRWLLFYFFVNLLAIRFPIVNIAPFKCSVTLHTIYCYFFLFNQLEWSSIPVCFLPKSLRGAPISHLVVSSLDMCTEPQHDESLNAASTSHNFLMHGTYNQFCHYYIFFLPFIPCFMLLSEGRAASRWEWAVKRLWKGRKIKEIIYQFNSP